jgi:isochorismate synthase
VQGHYRVKLPVLFDLLCNAYPDAFVYLFSVNGQCWMGASPEPFICSYENDLYTVSLAGTRSSEDRNPDSVAWQEKEQLEQEYVTRHIEKILGTFSVKHYRKKGPYTVEAGNLLHLRTDFTFPGCLSDQSLCALINALHPTPAVCGMSQGKALDFISRTERHDREYYTGFLGPVGLDDQLQLYMNLRCMKVLKDRLVLFIGGGITRESDPEEEWEETELKARTLLAVIQKV